MAVLVTDGPRVDPVAGRPLLSAGDARLESSPAAGRERDRPGAGALVALTSEGSAIIGHQLPVHSPISLGAIARAALRPFPSSEAPGPRLAGLLRDRYQADRVVLTGSGTQALHLALRAAVTARPGLVALPAFSCYDVVSAAIGARASATFYDLDPKTLGFDPESLEDALRAGATVVVAAPLYGVPWEWDRLRSLAARTGALLIEDAAQGHGAEWHGRPLGSLGDLSVLSFGRGKGWTGAAGGALLIRDRNIALPGLPVDSPGGDAVNVLRGAAQWLFGHPSLYGIPHALPFLALGESRYHPPRPVKPMGARTATMILASRGAADAEIAVRRRRAEYYRDRLQASGIGLVYTPAADVAPGWLRYPVLWPSTAGRGNALTGAELRLGIAPSYPLPLPVLPAAREFGDAAAMRFPGAMELAMNLLTLPTHSWIGDRDASRVIRALRAGSWVR